MCRAHELNLWLLSAPRVFIIFEALLSIDEVINGTCPPGPSHGVNQTKHGACELAVSFLGCSNFYTIPPKLYRRTRGTATWCFRENFSAWSSENMRYLFRNFRFLTQTGVNRCDKLKNDVLWLKSLNLI